MPERGAYDPHPTSSPEIKLVEPYKPSLIRPGGMQSQLFFYLTAVCHIRISGNVIVKRASGKLNFII